MLQLALMLRWEVDYEGSDARVSAQSVAVWEVAFIGRHAAHCGICVSVHIGGTYDIFFDSAHRKPLDFE